MLSSTSTFDYDRVVNLTGRAITMETTLGDRVKLDPDGRLNVQTQIHEIGRVYLPNMRSGVRFLRYVEQVIVDWPEPEQGTLYVVSNIVNGLAASNRFDIVGIGQVDRGGMKVARAFTKIERL